MPPPSLQDFIARWSDSAAAERANKDLFLTELCDVLGVARPQPATGEEHRDQYVFEKGALLLKDGQRTTTGHVDLYKAGCFVLEAKQGSRDAGTKTGTARRGTGAWSNAMQEAFGQALQYARTLDEMYFGIFPACRRPRFEPRARWPRRSPCAQPHALVRGQPGAVLELHVTYRAGRKHLPVVSMKPVA
jgi:hypothetical protein